MGYLIFCRAFFASGCSWSAAFCNHSLAFNVLFVPASPIRHRLPNVLWASAVPVSVYFWISATFILCNGTWGKKPHEKPCQQDGDSLFFIVTRLPLNVLHTISFLKVATKTFWSTVSGLTLFLFGIFFFLLWGGRVAYLLLQSEWGQASAIKEFFFSNKALFIANDLRLPQQEGANGNSNKIMIFYDVFYYVGAFYRWFGESDHDLLFRSA